MVGIGAIGLVLPFVPGIALILMGVYLFTKQDKKCKFWKECKLYDPESKTCNQTGGRYYEDGERPAGCYKRMEKKKFR